VGSTFAFYIRAKRADRPASRPTSLTGLAEQKWRESNTVKSFVQPEGAPAAGTDSRHILSADQTPVNLKDLSILLVEDNLVNQKVLKKQLQKLGCAVEVACHGGEALDYLKDCCIYKGKETSGHKLSLILMDLEMPVMDGLTCVHKIRELEKEGTFVNHIPIIAVTANVRAEQIAAAKDGGMVSRYDLVIGCRRLTSATGRCCIKAIPHTTVGCKNPGGFDPL
jgi:CheY-like chemotaxis protein